MSAPRSPANIDDVGGGEWNLELSRKRANSVMAELVHKGTQIASPPRVMESRIPSPTIPPRKAGP